MYQKKSLCVVAVLLLASALAMGGCGSKKTAADAGAKSQASAAQGESLDTAVSPDDNIMEGRTSGPMLPVYFDFDSATIKEDQAQRLETNADFLKKNPQIRIRIEGNCDPRGTQEYNLALGERRAQSSKKYLVNLGVDADRLGTVSWGEEKLLLFGQDELSWAQNRRDDFVIEK